MKGLIRVMTGVIVTSLIYIPPMKPVNAEQNQWVLLGSGHESKLYIDSSSILRVNGNGLRKASVKYIHDNGDYNYRVVEKYTISCTQGKFFLNELTSYNKDGQKTIEKNYTHEHMSWKYIKENTAGELIYRVVCK